MIELNPTEAPGIIAGNLLTTLMDEESALLRLRGHFARQLDCIRTHHHRDLEQATLDTNDEVALLGQIRQSRERQVRLLGRAFHVNHATLSTLIPVLMEQPETHAVGLELSAARDRVRGLASDTQQRCDELEFALQYAIQLGRDVVQALQGIDETSPARVYTAGGNTTVAARPRSLLNRLG